MKIHIYLAAVLMLFALVSCDSSSSTTGGNGQDSTATGASTTPDLSGTYKVDATKSSVTWTGTKADKPDAHNGTLTITEGNLQLDKDGYLTGGTVSVDMKSIANTDGMPDKMKNDLETHLKSAEFFNVENFATATYTITGVTKGASDGNYDVTGKLSAIDKSLDVSFPATVGKTGDEINASGSIKLADTDFGFQKFAGSIDVAVMLVAKK